LKRIAAPGNNLYRIAGFGSDTGAHAAERGRATRPAATAPWRGRRSRGGPDYAVQFSPRRRDRQAQAVFSLFLDAELWAIDADGLVCAPGPRLVDGVAAIAAILHREATTAKPSTIARVA
jgi:iron complex transport system substrate-binding protein